MLNEFGSTYYLKNKWRLPFHWDDITLNEAVFILEKLHEKLLDELAEDEEKELCRLLLIAFWVGRPVSDVLGFHFTQKIPKNLKLEGIYCNSTGAYFLIHVSGPDLKENKFASGKSTLKTTTQIQLEIPESLLMSLNPYLTDLSKTKRRQPLFKFSLPDLEEQCEDMLRQLKDRRFKRITVRKLTRYIPLMIELQDGSDPATAGLILGSESANRTPRSNYTTLQKTPLTRIYEEVTKSIEIHLNFIKQPPLILTESFPKCRPEDSDYLGSPFRPSQEALRTFVKDLVDNIEDFDS